MARRKAQEVLTVDPGLGGTGWCYWAALHPKTLAPTRHGVLTAPRSIGWQSRVTWIAGAFAILLRGELRIGSPCSVVIEWPKLWAGSAKSMAAAEKDDLFKLTYLIGALGSRAAMITSRQPVLLPVNTWKGQLPKREILRRLKKLTGIRFKNHEGDAAGMGMHLLGLLNEE
jgi:hypothetical protein